MKQARFRTHSVIVARKSIRQQKMLNTASFVPTHIAPSASSRRVSFQPVVSSNEEMCAKFATVSSTSEICFKKVEAK